MRALILAADPGISPNNAGLPGLSVLKQIVGALHEGLAAGERYVEFGPAFRAKVKLQRNKGYSIVLQLFAYFL